MSGVLYKTTPFRAALALAAGVTLALVVAELRVWAAFLALGAAEWFELFLQHLQTMWTDYAPSFVFGILVWIVFDRRRLRDARYAALVGIVSFYVAPRVFALIYIFQSPYRMPDLLARLLLPRTSEVALGALLALGMWAIAYWRPMWAKRAGKINEGLG